MQNQWPASPFANDPRLFRGIAGPTNLAGINPADILYLQQVMGKNPDGSFKFNFAGIQRTYDHVLFDRVRVIAGTAMPAGAFTFFAQTVGNTRSVLNAAATTYSLSPIDTNMQANGMLPKDNYFIVKTLGLKMEITGTEAATVTLGEQLDPTPTGANAAHGSVNPSSTSNLYEALYGANVILSIQSTDYEQGPPWMFPSEWGMSGWAGAGTTNNNESIAQNQTVFGRRLNPWHLLKELQNFSITLQWYDLWTPRQDFYITAEMHGTYFSAAR